MGVQELYHWPSVSFGKLLSLQKFSKLFWNQLSSFDINTTKKIIWH